MNLNSLPLLALVVGSFVRGDPTSFEWCMLWAACLTVVIFSSHHSHVNTGGR